jgi:FkbM family methyltransferase
MSLKAIYYPDTPFESLCIPNIYKEIYLDKVYSDVCNNRRDMTIIDIGANIGIVTSFLRDYSKKLYAIEPSTEHFEALKQNKEYNQWDNVEIFNCAVADRDGQMKLSLSDANKTIHSLVFEEKLPTQHLWPRSELVKTTRLDSFLTSNKIDYVDFIKFDVEGAEEMILTNNGFISIAQRVKTLIVEFHFPDYPKLVNHMKSLGYKEKQYRSDVTIFLFTR